MIFHNEKFIYEQKVYCSRIIEHEIMHELLPPPPTLSVGGRSPYTLSEPTLLAKKWLRNTLKAIGKAGGGSLRETRFMHTK